MPFANIVDCSVCGFLLDGPIVCPACGSDNPPVDSQGAEIEKETFADLEIATVNVLNVENQEKTSHDPVDLSIIRTPELPFDIDDAPIHSSNEALPFGLDYAPFIPNN